VMVDRSQVTGMAVARLRCTEMEVIPTVVIPSRTSHQIKNAVYAETITVSMLPIGGRKK
jgi:hypothetical protein